MLCNMNKANNIERRMFIIQTIWTNIWGSFGIGSYGWLYGECESLDYLGIEIGFFFTSYLPILINF